MDNYIDYIEEARELAANGWLPERVEELYKQGEIELRTLKEYKSIREVTHRNRLQPKRYPADPRLCILQR